MSDQPVCEVDKRDVAVVASIGVRRLDHNSTNQLKAEVAAAAAGAPRYSIILDMSKLEFVPSVALGALVDLVRTLRQGGQRLLLVGLNRQIRSTLAVTRLDKLMEIFTDADDALEKLRHPA
jgi:anti-anti-sigma factor